MSRSDAQRSESPGPLAFHRSPNSRLLHLCGWASCQRRGGRYMKSGRYRVTLLGYPWIEDNTQLWVCTTCRKDMERLWDELSSHRSQQSPTEVDGPAAATSLAAAELVAA